MLRKKQWDLKNSQINILGCRGQYIDPSIAVSILTRWAGTVPRHGGAVPLQEHGLYLIQLEMGLTKKLKYSVNQNLCILVQKLLCNLMFAYVIHCYVSRNCLILNIY